MIRFLILAGYVELMIYLEVSGRLNQYINVHYQYLAVLSLILAAILAATQLVLWVRAGDGKPVHHHEHEGHDHGLTKRHQRVLAYILLSLPSMVGWMFPTVSLDTSIVDAKGFNFPISKESVGDPEMNTQYLKPDTSIYYNKSDYENNMEKLKKKYIKNDVVHVTEENYLEVIELIYDYPSEFEGKQIAYKGFIYQTKKDDKNYIFAFRFGIIHCVADSGVFGLLTEMPSGQTFSNNQWVTVTGTIEIDYFSPYKRDIPTLRVSKVTNVDKPKNEYVYRSF